MEQAITSIQMGALVTPSLSKNWEKNVPLELIVVLTIAVAILL
jgi:hypothetical protein